MFQVLVVDDTRLMRALISGMLRKLDISCTEAGSGEEALRLYEQSRPGLILLDVNMPGIDGYHVAREIRARYPDEWVPIIFLSGREESEDLRMGIEAGGDDYLTKPVDPVVLKAKITAMRRIEDMRCKLVAVTTELAEANEKLRLLSQEDGLTGIANRRTFDFVLDRELGRCQRSNSPISVILGDVDHFKAFNDTYGHPSGDQCLRAVASALKATCRRQGDLVARYGGEEFAVILPDTDPAGAVSLARQLVKSVAMLKMPHRSSPTASHVTMSFGVATAICSEQHAIEPLLNRADQALYQAKRLGRNRIHLCGQAASSLGISAAA